MALAVAPVVLIATGDDGIHVDDTLTILSGTIQISESYEGLEGLHILVSGGEINRTAMDDGLNAAGGTDSSGFGGPRGNDMFGGASNGSIVISGGSIYMNASGDGIDAMVPWRSPVDTQLSVFPHKAIPQLWTMTPAQSLPVAPLSEPAAL